MTNGFAGFQPGAIQFLLELRANNDRSWFQPRKADYERLLKEPLEALCVALGERFAARGIPMRADSGSPFRIYRDVRFSKDKSPYKTYISASFPWVADREVAAPARGRGEPSHRVGGYFHFDPDEWYVGGGMWHPERPAIEAWRGAVATDPKRIHAVIDDPTFVKAFGEVEGDSLLRVPPGYPADHPDARLLKLKEVIFGRRLTEREIRSPRLPDTLADTFATASPVMRLLDSLAR
jgi:uncharacterized protein (TIGR02453 family)